MSFDFLLAHVKRLALWCRAGVIVFTVGWIAVGLYKVAERLVVRLGCCINKLKLRL